MGLDQQRLLSAVLFQRLHAEAREQSWVACLLIDGRAQMIKVDAQGLEAEPEQKIFAQDLCEALDKELSYNGSWVIQWCHPGNVSGLIMVQPEYQRCNIIWLDEDGDPQFTIEIDDPIYSILQSGKIHWMDQCNQAWESWKHSMRDLLDPGEGQLYKAALGEKPPSERGYNA